VSMFGRLLFHDVDIVGAQYVAHDFLSLFHGAHLGRKPDANGLMPMEQIPLGFSKITRHALETIRQKHPERQYKIKRADKTEEPAQLFEFFPSGVVVCPDDYSKNHMLGEDYYFCKLAKESGLTPHIDTQLIVPHETKMRLPIKNGSILDACLERWRKKDESDPADIARLVGELRNLLGSDPI